MPPRPPASLPNPCHHATRCLFFWIPQPFSMVKGAHLDILGPSLGRFSRFGCGSCAQARLGQGCRSADFKLSHDFSQHAGNLHGNYCKHNSPAPCIPARPPCFHVIIPTLLHLPWLHNAREMFQKTGFLRDYLFALVGSVFVNIWVWKR